MKEAEIQALKAEFPQATLHLATVGETQVVLRDPPTRTSFKAWRNSADMGRHEQFVIDNILFPKGIDIHALFERQPGIGENLAMKLAKFAGLAEEAITQKL